MFHVSHLDKDECSGGPSPCSHTCRNAPGRFSCSCPAGFSLAWDRRNCRGEQPGEVSSVLPSVQSSGPRFQRQAQACGGAHFWKIGGVGVVWTPRDKPVVSVCSSSL